MRITNKDYSPIEVVSELVFKTNRISDSDTKEFFSGERESHDWLVEMLAQKINVVLDSFQRYGTEVRETQFIRDNGVDVRLDFRRADDSEYRVGFQVKSNNEAISDADRRNNSPSMVATLKRQAFEAERNACVNEWWIFSCFNTAINKHKKLVSTINVELGTGKSGEMKIRHVTPREAMALLMTDDDEIDAICTLLLCKDDEILIMARNEVYQLSECNRAIVLETIVDAIEYGAVFSLNEISQIAEQCESFEDDKFLGDMDYLENSIRYLYTEDGSTYSIKPTEFLGLCGLYFEARARHKHSPAQAKLFLLRITTL